MGKQNNQDLQAQLNKLLVKIEEAKECGPLGQNVAQRVEGDLQRIMNSAWLTLYDITYENEQEKIKMIGDK
jgi:hypothetical protein